MKLAPKEIGHSIAVVRGNLFYLNTYQGIFRVEDGIATRIVTCSEITGNDSPVRTFGDTAVSPDGKELAVSHLGSLLILSVGGELLSTIGSHGETPIDGNAEEARFILIRELSHGAEIVSDDAPN